METNNSTSTIRCPWIACSETGWTTHYYVEERDMVDGERRRLAQMADEGTARAVAALPDLVSALQALVDDPAIRELAARRSKNFDLHLAAKNALEKVHGP